MQHVLDEFRDCADLTHRSFPEIQVHLVYFSFLSDPDKLDRDVIRPLRGVTREEVPRLLRETQFQAVTDRKQLIEGILKGQTALFYRDEPYLVDVLGPKERSIGQSETETVITGPHDAFNENAGSNLSLIRKRVRSSHLKVVKLSVGEVAKNDVYVLYIDGIVNPIYVQKIIERVRQIEVDAITDTSMLIQYIDDSPLSIFPQFLTSERPDAIASKLVSGRVIGMMDGSPSAFSAPTSLFEFFTSSDDYYQRWLLGTGTRLLRFVAFGITVTFTALYVAVATYHYEMIPANLLPTFVESRSRVPFPPVYEALLMETTIELLREAGARLPTKIGQTIGIVGGIVIGQAAVQAGFTSNILIIAVASSAIASFVIPSYVMSASIRLVRFGLILLAGLWGNFGLAIGLAFVVIHLSGLTSLGASFISPLAPLQFKDWKDTFIRAPFKMLKERPEQTEALNPVRMKTRK
nr:spore germination protein [Cohnella sp. YIM B05605]